MKELRDIKLDLLLSNRNTIVDLFNEITNGITIINCNVYNKEGLEFIYHKDGEWIFYQDAKNEKFWCNYSRYWSIFKSKLDMEYKDIQSITKLLVEETLKRELSTPSNFTWRNDWKVEETLKREISTPSIIKYKTFVAVEETLKREISKPYFELKKIDWKVEATLKQEISKIT